MEPPESQTTQISQVGVRTCILIRAVQIRLGMLPVHMGQGALNRRVCACAFPVHIGTLKPVAKTTTDLVIELSMVKRL